MIRQGSGRFFYRNLKKAACFASIIRTANRALSYQLIKKEESSISIGKDDKSKITLSVVEDNNGGILSVFGKDGKSKITLSTNDNGGIIGVFGKGDDAKSVISIGEHGGRVYARGNDGKSMAQLGVDENGGYLSKRTNMMTP